MRTIQERLRHNGLFMIMFLITVISIIIVSIVITWTTIRMSERFFIEKFSITNAKIINQVKESLESFNYSVLIASNNLLQNGTIKRILTKEQSNAEMMNSIYHLNQQMTRIKSNLDAYEVGITVTGMNGVDFSTDRTYWPISDEELRNHSITANTIKEPKRIMYQYDFREYEGIRKKEESYLVASRAFVEQSSDAIYGTMYIAIQESEFRKFYHNYTSIGNDVFILDKEGLIVSTNRSELIGEKAKELLNYAKEMEEGSDPYINGSFMDQDYIILSQYLPMFDMHLVNLIDKKMAIGKLIDKKELFLICMAIVLGVVMMVYLISSRLTNSLSHVVKEIADASKHEFHQYVSVSGMYETRQIGKAFNSMLDELHDYVEKLLLTQKQKRNAELAALQQQINPHFLYNTLASVKFMVQQGSNEDAEEMINALISLLQNTIGDASETVTVEQELVNIKNYVFIKQKRYGNRIKVNYFVSPDSMDCIIPKLIIQPFIENAFFHGFNRKAEGAINILIWQNRDSLVCEIMDNGDGMEVSCDSKLPNTKRNQQLLSGIGVRNVHERIQLIYGEQYGVEMTSKLGEGTKVNISLPIQKSKNSLII